MLRELIVPVGVIAILASMILPLPPTIIDLLLVANLVLALVLLVSTLYISEPTKLSALPTLLLLATLYRLALNISTTRLILGTGEGGEMIEAFGNIVVEGNLIVGAVVFLVVTLVQFIVIAKGAERVAEVSARFTLDALPGKQMSIDADVRAGLLDFQSARAKREDLQLESRFYGALDGAMKFIKGDAIAGIVITTINVLGGLACGMLFAQLDFVSALNQYTLLSIGDGLLSQIPALLNSLSAGIIVTRVVSEEGSSVANDLLKQLGGMRQVQLFVAGVAVVFGSLSGMPAWPFLVLACLLLMSAALNKRRSESEKLAQPEPFEPGPPPTVEVFVSKTLLSILSHKGSLSDTFHRCMKRVFLDTGLILELPHLSFSADDDSRLVHVNVRGIEAVQRTIDGEEIEGLEELLYETMVKFRGEIIDDILTRRTLDFFEQKAPELVSTVVPGLISVTQLTRILRDLSQENVNLRNFDLILQSIAEAAPRVECHDEILEEVRIALGRVIVQPHCTRNEEGVSELSCVTFEPALDLRLAEKDPARMLPMGVQEKIFQEIREREYSVLVVSRQARRVLFQNLSLRKIRCTVLAFDEIPLGVEIRVRENMVFPQEYKEEIAEQLAA